MASTFKTRWNVQVLIIIFTSVVVSYTLVRTGVIQLPDAKKKNSCPPSALISSNQEDNLRKIVNYPLVDSNRYMNRLGLQEGELTEVPGAEPVVVTATQANHFAMAQGLIQRLNANMQPKLKIVVFDIGMSKDQRNSLCTGGKCEIKDFPFALYPSFLEDYLPANAWKPVVIQIALKEYGFVIWMDTAVYLPQGYLQGGIDIAEKAGVAAGYRRIAHTDVNLAFETDQRTFTHLGEEPCAFKETFRYNAALLFIKGTPFTYKYIMRPWVSCALTLSCISADHKFYSQCAGADKYGYCHRFDQSVLSIILNRLFHSDVHKIDLGDKVVWTKCYIKDQVEQFNEMALIKNDQNGIKCPEVS